LARRGPAPQLDSHDEALARTATQVDYDRVGRIVGELLEIRRPLRRRDVDLLGQRTEMRNRFCGVR
jgi:hypothetical protein